MYRFPENLYTDVRVENVAATSVIYENLVLKQNKTKAEKGAMIRVYDGEKWYYSATTDILNVQDEIDSLAAMAKPNEKIQDDPVVRSMEVNKGKMLCYAETDISKVPNKDKISLAEEYLPMLEEVPEIQLSKVFYIDNHTEKHIMSSKGTDVTFDTQNGCIVVKYVLSVNDLPQRGAENIYGLRFEEMKGRQEKIRNTIRKDLEYARSAVPVVPGTYTCILSPMAAGVFAHESFGHKSESDFMIGDETMKREWALGSKVGSPILNIIDTGIPEGSGYVPFDDEGSKAKENYIIKEGILSGRLHSAYTAAALQESATGNARALNFEYEPIVRMTTTYIGSGHHTKDDLFAGVKNGIYIDDIIHGSGMTIFTIAPSRAYMIRDGNIAEALKIAVISGNVMETLNEIDGLSDTVEIMSFGSGGCGKMEQYPLRVGFGGPYVRVNKIKVQ